MPVRLLPRFAAVGLICTLAIGGCKSDAPTTPSDNATSFGKPLGLLSVGTVVDLNMNVDDACTNASLRPARVVAVGTRSVIFADTANPKNGFTTADYQRFAAKFDTLIYPTVVENFGEPTDVDKNGGRISIIFTRVVNELTPARASAYVGGLAFSRDLFPRVGDANGRASTCLGSNEGEYFYAITPDPSGSINTNVRSTGFVDSNTTALLAHELEHIINSSRRLYVTNATAFEDKWLDEGLAHIAEELLFYRESGLGPRMNLNATALRSTARILTAFNLDMPGNMTRYRSYLTSPSVNSPYAANDSLPTRGAGWSLLRYSVDRVNATDGFVAGTGQVATAPGDVVLTPGAATGEYIATVVNTALQNNGSANFTLRATSANGSILADAPTVPAYLRVPVPTRDDGPAHDRAFEARVRDRERAVLTPLMGNARRWYAARERALEPSLSRSASSVSTVADADGLLWTRLVNNTSSGIANYQSIVGGEAVAFVRDWAVSNAIDDVAALNTQYQQRSWNFQSIYPALFNTQTHPLTIQTLATTGIASTTLVSGGAAYYRITVAANGSATLNISTVGNATNPNLHLVVVKVK